jgi:hypothetical protein
MKLAARAFVEGGGAAGDSRDGQLVALERSRQHDSPLAAKHSNALARKELFKGYR